MTKRRQRSTLGSKLCSTLQLVGLYSSMQILHDTIYFFIEYKVLFEESQHVRKLSGYNVLYYQSTIYYYTIRVQCTKLSGYNVLLYYQSTMYYYTIRLQCTILSGYNVLYYQGTMQSTIRVQCTILSGYNVLYYQVTMYYYTIRVQCTILSGYLMYNTIRLQCTILSGYNVLYYQGTMYYTTRVQCNLL